MTSVLSATEIAARNAAFLKTYREKLSSSAAHSTPPSKPPSKPVSTDWAASKAQYDAAREQVKANPALLESWSRRLGISLHCLDDFDAAVCPRGRLLTPEYDANGVIIGVQERRIDPPPGKNEKTMLPGSKRGLIHAVGFSVVRSGTDDFTDGKWIGVERSGKPCEVCGKPDWCSVTRDGNAFACRRINEGSVKELKDGSWLHVIRPQKPSHSNADDLHIVEGFSDAAKLYELGVDVIGKPNNVGGNALLTAKLAGTRRPIIVWGERDQKPDGRWPGREGMEKTASALVHIGLRVIMILPPDLGPAAKDARGWINNHNINAEELKRHIEHQHEQPPVIEGDSGRTTPSALVGLTSTYEFFLNGGTPFVSFPTKPGSAQVVSVESDTFANHILAEAVKQFQAAPSEQAVTDCQRFLQGRTLNEGSEQPIFNRLAWDEPNRRFVIDMADEGNHFIIVTESGYEVREFPRPPLHFRRLASTGPLSWPVNGGSLAELRLLINVDDNDFILYVASLLSPYLPYGSVASLAAVGGQGGGKSKVTEIHQRCFDPQRHPPGVDEEESPLPATERDLAVIAQVSAMLAFNNLSSISPAMTDAICRLVSGGRLDHRSLYTNDGLTRFSARRFVILAGISEELLSRADLRDRSLVVHLLPLDPSKRIAEREFYRRFEEMRPRVFGAVLNAVSTALKNLPTTPGNSFRMGEFVRFVQAAEPAMPWNPGDFLRAYDIDRENARESALEISALGQMVISLIRNQEPKDGFQRWTGTVKDLLHEWDRVTAERRLVSGGKVAGDFPPCPPVLRNNLREAGIELSRILPALRMMGIQHEKRKGTAGIRLHTFIKRYIPPVPSAKPGNRGAK